MKNALKNKINSTVVQLAYKMDYPIDAVFDIPSIRIVGRDTIIVEGCKGLIEYASNRITLNLGSFSISIYGNELVMENLADTGMNIIGDISSITFDKRI